MQSLIPKHGGYKTLKTFQLAQLIYDITVRFCDKFVSRYSRTHDQMVQAARSGVQNIAEGSQASATSKKSELQLTNVARGSLEELKLDYEDYLRQHQLNRWNASDTLRKEFVQQRFGSANDFAFWVKNKNLSSRNDLSEIAANGVLQLISTACKLLDRQIAAQADAFQREGGFTERLYHARKILLVFLLKFLLHPIFSRHDFAAIF